MPQVTVMVDEHYQMRDVAENLRANGFELLDSYDAAGIIIGTCSESVFGMLPTVQGVQAVEKVGNVVQARPRRF